MHLIVTLLSAVAITIIQVGLEENTYKDTSYSPHLKQDLYTANVNHKPKSAYVTCNFYAAIVGYFKCQII